MAPSPKRSTFPPKSLSDLPTDVIDDIMCRLPVTDAVRTSVLSRAWRRRWRSIPDLHVGAGDSASVVDHVLRHRSSHIRSFSVSSCRHVSSRDVSRWLVALSANSDPSLRSLTIESKNSWFGLASTLISFRNLTHLELKGCALSSSRSLFLGFPSLETLILHQCYFPEKHGNVEEFVASCPLLEKLVFVDVIGGEYFNIRAPNLRSLIFHGRFVQFSLFDAPLLKAASIGFLEVMPESPPPPPSYDESDDELSYEYPPSSYDESDDELYYEYSMEKCNLIEVFGRVRSIEKLDLVSRSLHLLGQSGIPEMGLNCFERLRVLTLKLDFYCVKETSVMLCLLRSSPNLQELEIKGSGYRWNMGLGHWFWQKQVHLELPKLQTLRLAFITCAGPKLEFIYFVLQRAQGLKKLVITLAPGFEKDGRINELKSKQQMKCWKNFTKAEITFIGTGQSK